MFFNPYRHHVVIMFVLGMILASMIAPSDNVPVSAQDQETDSNIYLINDFNLDIMRIQADGETDILPLKVEDNTYYESIAIRENVAVYCLAQLMPENTNFRLHVIDIETESLLHDIDFGEQAFCRVAPNAIRGDGASVAVATVQNVSQGDPPQSFTWTLSIIDLATGEIAHEINRSRSDVDDSGIGLIPMPDVRQFNENPLFFAVIPWGTEGTPVDTAYEWNISEDSITPREYWGNMFVDYLPASGETVYIEADPDLPAPLQSIPLPAFNVVRVVDASGSITTIHTNDEEFPIDVKFIDGGQAVAVGLMKLDDTSATSSPETRTYRYIRIDRGGTVTDLGGIDGARIQVLPYMDTHAFFIQNNNSTPATFIEVPTSDGVEMLWQSEASSWRLIGYSSAQATTDLAPFQAE